MIHGQLQNVRISNHDVQTETGSTIPDILPVHFIKNVGGIFITSYPRASRYSFCLLATFNLVTTNHMARKFEITHRY